MLTVKHKGNFNKTEKFLRDNRNAKIIRILEKYAKEGVEALKAATPKDTGKTAESWDYEITVGKGGPSITFTNSNVNEYVSIALILQYGHATGTGGYVQGVDYINPALKPVFDQIVKKAWREVTKV